MSIRFDERVAIVTGAGQGLGRSHALQLAARGCRVVVNDFGGAAQTVVDEIVAAGGQAIADDGNVCDSANVDAMVARAMNAWGRVDILINNAGILRDGLLLKVKDGEMTKMSLAQWQAVIDVNLTGVFLCTREVAAKMVELKNSGAIINISSISRAGNVGQTNYSAAKAGVAAATVTWAKELARYGIRVAGIAPGFIETEMTLGMKPEALEKMTSGIPLKRMGKPEEIAHSAAYIFENDYYTGRILEMDGGLRI